MITDDEALARARRWAAEGRPAQGRVFFLHWAEDFFVGAGIDNALIALIRGNDGWPEASDRTW